MIEKTNLPKGWELKKLGEVCEKITKGGTPTTYGFSFVQEGINFLKIENIKQGKVNLATIKTFITEEAHYFQKKSILQENDLLFSIAGTIGETCLIKKDYLPANTNQALAILRGYGKYLEPKFLTHQLDSSISQYVKSKARGGAMNNISLEDLKGIELVIPPLSAQTIIIAKIEELLSELENGKQQLLTAQAQLKVYRQSLLKWAFEGKLTNKNVKEGELPEGWKWVKLGDVASKITDGEHITPRRTSNGIFLLSARNIQNGHLELKNVDYIPIDEYERIIKRCNPEYGDILISCSGSIGRVCRVPSNLKFTLVRSVALIKFDWINSSSKFYEYLFQSPLLQSQIEKSKKATAQANLFLGPIKNLDVIVCPLTEQNRIVEELESKLTICDKIEETISQSLAQSETLRQSILKKAFEGKLL